MERYQGYDNVVQFVKVNNRSFGSIAIVNTLPYYHSRKFSEFFTLAYLSKNKVYFAPIEKIMDINLFEEKNIDKMVILTEGQTVVYASDSLFEKNGAVLKSYIEGDSLYLSWLYNDKAHLRLLIVDPGHKVILNKPVPFNNESVYTLSIHLENIGLSKKGVYTWLVCKISYSKFLPFPGRFIYD